MRSRRRAAFERSVLHVARRSPRAAPRRPRGRWRRCFGDSDAPCGRAATREGHARDVASVSGRRPPRVSSCAKFHVAPDAVPASLRARAASPRVDRAPRCPSWPLPIRHSPLASRRAPVCMTNLSAAADSPACRPARDWLQGPRARWARRTGRSVGRDVSYEIASPRSSADTVTHRRGTCCPCRPRLIRSPILNAVRAVCMRSALRTRRTTSASPDASPCPCHMSVSHLGSC